MYNEVKSFDELKTLVLTDKRSTGLDIYVRNRYPIRFVLFDNFRDCSAFIDFVQEEMGAMVQSVDKWIDPEYPDIMITYTELAERIKQHIKKMEGADCIIAPFSELARFYDNIEKKTFDALLKTIKAIESSAVAAERFQRVYIPIVGLEGKMELFKKDSQSIIWRLVEEDKSLSYRLILTDRKTFGVKGLEKHFTVVGNIHEWLNIWKDADKQVTPNIISTSHAIFANALYAQPDNAFSFVNCNNTFDFLTKGLQLEFGGMTKALGDDDNWDSLANDIDISNGFSFSVYVRNYFSTSDIDNYQLFIKQWLEHPGKYERWLLSRYYQLQQDGECFICRMLTKTTALTGNELIENIALEMSEIEQDINARRYCLIEAAKHNVVLRDGVESTIVKRLEAIAKKYNAASTLRYFTGISSKEKELAIIWLGKGLISKEQVKPFFPDLYNYVASPLGISANVPEWLTRYMDSYKKAKLMNAYTEEIQAQINELNGSDVKFDTWYQGFSTTRTLLQGRSDIEVFYWIDGLGVEWISLIKEIIREKNSHGIFLNDIKIARALLPTTTHVNREDLQKLLPPCEKLLKVGDLDKIAHDPNNMPPSTIINEIKLVRETIEEIVMKYNGKKVAIISDHGLTYLSQLCDGLGLSGVTPDHHGRLATKNSGSWSADAHYFRLDDGKTACALQHQSLCNKVPKGQGAHGGCTPEEVLVPIFIISNDVTDSKWSAELLTLDITGANPIVEFRIKNAPSTEVPVVEYNGIQYKLNQIGQETYQSESLCLVETCDVVSLIIGQVIRHYKVNITTGAKEADLFGDF